MRVVLLGTAAGGGFPQWNCWCPTCRAARSEPHRAVPRSQSSAAISSDGERWFLLNASPDIRNQLPCLPAPLKTDVRHAPLEGVLITDAELDHTLGIVLLRESPSLQLYLTPAVESILEMDTRILPVTRAFAEVKVTHMNPGERTPLRYRDGDLSGIWVEPFAVPAGPPRFASESPANHTVGLIIEDEATGGSCGYVPGCGDLSETLLEKLGHTDLVLFDGTFWSNDELIALGISDRHARDMDHMPISGSDGSLARLAGIPRPRKLYTHINNTNPILLEDSPERAGVDQAGVAVGSDGMCFTV